MATRSFTDIFFCRRKFAGTLYRIPIHSQKESLLEIHTTIDVAVIPKHIYLARESLRCTHPDEGAVWGPGDHNNGILLGV